MEVGGGGGRRLYTCRFTDSGHHQNDTCIKIGSDGSHFLCFINFREGQSHKTVPQTTTFEEKGQPKRIRTEVPLLTSLTPYR